MLKVQRVDVLVSLSGRMQRGFIANIGNVGTCRGKRADALEPAGQASKAAIRIAADVSGYTPKE